MCNEAMEWTNRIYAAMDEGLIDPRTIAEACLQYMGEIDVEDMVRANDLQDFLGAL